MTTLTPDPPFYTRLPDGRYVHICTMPDHSRYWFNVGALLWVCERCHPTTLGSARRGMVGEVREVGEIVKAERVTVE